jgi:hypothetical protein
MVPMALLLPLALPQMPPHRGIYELSHIGGDVERRRRPVDATFDQGGCDASSSMRPRICPNRRCVKWLSASWRSSHGEGCYYQSECLPPSGLAQEMPYRV